MAEDEYVFLTKAGFKEVEAIDDEVCEVILAETKLVDRDVALTGMMGSD